MNKFNSVVLSTAVTTALILGSGPVLAQTGDSAASGKSMKTIVETVQMLESKGYTHIDEIDRDMDHYDVEATNSSGQRVELKIDGASGEILRSEREDD